VGQTYQFECPKCGYKTRVSGKGDRGFNFSVQTILCRDCKKLYDAVVRLKVADEPLPRSFSRTEPTPARRMKFARVTAPAFDAAVNQLPLPGAKPSVWLQFKIRCPVSSVHKVQVWNEPGKCPRCAVYLEKNALPFRVWE